MNMHNPLRIIFLFAVAGLTQLMCTTGLSGVETTNGFTITATSTTIEGTAPAYSTVYLFDTAYVPYIDSGFGYGTAVTSEENFSFALSSGLYNIFVYDHSGDLAGIAQKVGLANTSESHQQSMKKTSSITGSIILPENASALVYIPGSNFYCFLNASGPFTLSGIPGGNFRVNVARLSDTFSPLTVHYSTRVDVSANSTYDCGSITID